MSHLYLLTYGVSKVIVILSKLARYKLEMKLLTYKLENNLTDNILVHLFLSILQSFEKQSPIAEPSIRQWKWRDRIESIGRCGTLDNEYRHVDDTVLDRKY